MSTSGARNTISFALALATSQFNHGLNQASASLNGFARDANGSLSTIATSAGVMGAALGAAFAVTVGRAMEFESAMSNVAAVSGATGKEFDALRQQALDLGASSVFSATEAAAAQEALAKAGIKSADILGGGLQGTLALAAAANMDMAQAAEIAANSMNMFNLSAREVPHVADVIAAAANKSAMTAHDFGMAMKQAGSAANLTGMGFEETAASIAIFADAGIKGSDAGTSLKTMLLRLNPSTAAATEAMDKYGLSFKDRNDDFVDLENVAGQLETKLGHLGDAQRTQVLQTIFGSDAIRASALLYEAGAEGVAQMTQAVDDNGYAAEVARIKMDNLSGDVERLSGAFETMLVDGGSGVTGSLRQITQTATHTVDQLNELPPAVGHVAVGATGLGSAALIGVAGLGAFIPMARNVKTAMNGLGGAAASMTSVMTMRNFAVLTGAVVGLGAAFVMVSSQIQGAKQRAAEAHAVFMASVDVPVDLDSYVVLADQMAERIGALQARYAAADGASGGFWDNTVRGAEKAFEMFPGGNDVLAETSEELKLLQDEYEGVAASGFAYGTIVNELARKQGVSVDVIEQQAKAYGIDLVGASDAAVAVLADLGEAVDWTNQKLTPEAAAEVAAVLNSELAPGFAAAHAEANRAAPAVIGLEDAIEEAGDEAKTAEERLDAFNDSVDRMVGLMRGPAAASRDFTESMWKVHEAAKALNEVRWHGFNESIPEAYAYQDAMDGLIESYATEIKLARERNAPQSEMDALYGKMTRTIEDMAAMGMIGEEQVTLLNQQVALIPRQTDAHITAHTADADVALRNLSGVIDWATRPRNVQIWLTEAYRSAPIPHVNATRPGLASIFNADGNILAFAAGGFHDAPHVAQIARGGPIRRWNEPETGGESYIPLSPNKRPRSVEILRQTNGLMGDPLGVGGGTTVHVDVGGVTVSAPNYVGDQRQLARAIGDAVRSDAGLTDTITRAIARGQSARSGART